ncbi:hypothetical protein HXX76_007633 [Chlamydomonas incerta]|uniref:Ankyrin repeat domain-containing protein n=1 Tax=Chlamydomonas incerta TaxID=51695 RepID=A0A835T994_CHLIN|nr:hypothetical protein HXX76_007633 [Chlamydomonas incerta]|eukprot:KAG2434745.1 hypothetical protein HXX76_007633 [Chlamydomonas incerta]
MPDPARLWIPDLVCRYAAFLPLNEIPCTLRLVNKATASLFPLPRHTTIQPILPVPPHYFRRCWGAPALAAAAAAASTEPSPQLQQQLQQPALASAGSGGVAGQTRAVEPGNAGPGCAGAVALTAAAAGTAGQPDANAARPAAAPSAAEDHAGTCPPSVTRGEAAAASAPTAEPSEQLGDGAGAAGCAGVDHASLAPARSATAGAPTPQAAAAAAAAAVCAPASAAAGPLPRGVYAESCGGDLLWLTGRQRAMLLNATAASGVVENLEVLLDPRLVDFFPRSGGALTYAAAAGHADVLWLLRRRGFPWSHAALVGAVRNGDMELVRKALSDGCGRWGTLGTLSAAASCGQTAVYEFMLQKQRRVGWMDKPKFLMGLLEDVAYGCSLQQMKDILANPPPFRVDWEWMHVTAFAASSPTPDWREKVEWLEEQGHDKNVWAAERVVKLFGVDWRRAGGGAGALWGLGRGTVDVINPAAGYWGNPIRDDARVAAARIAAAQAASAAAAAAAARELAPRAGLRKASAAPLGGAEGAFSGAAAATERAGGSGGGAAAAAARGPLLQATTVHDEQDLYKDDLDDFEAYGSAGGGPASAAPPATASAASARPAAAPAATAAAAAPGAQEAIERLTWLRDRGYPIGQTAVREAAAAGNVAALQFLLTECGLGRRRGRAPGTPLGGGEGGAPQLLFQVEGAGGGGGGGGGGPNSFTGRQQRLAVREAVAKAAKAGHFACLKLLHQHGYPVASAAVLEAAVLSGRLQIIAWALKRLLLHATWRRAADGASGSGRGGAPRQAEAPAPDAAGGEAAGDGAGGGGEPAAAAPAGPTPAHAGAVAQGAPAGAAGAGPARPRPAPEDPKPRQHPLEAALGGRERAEHTGASLAINAVVAGGGQGLSVRLLDWLHARRLLSLRNPAVFTAAAGCGGRPALEWCAAHGCAWDGSALEEAARSGSVAVVEWLVAHGCPIGGDGVPYILAASASQAVTLRALRRLGVPWNPDGSTFTTAVRSTGNDGRTGGLPHVPVGVLGLRKLRDVGCPIDWAALKLMAKDKRPPPASLYEWRKDELSRFLNEPQSKALRKQARA